ncbi:MAG: MFS transporter [SAR202 cluster bacterium Io17-Chloro-G4]|nr:MAG: MFS transporter [SAR202 cluster bacterium Io17-Chloro-G4]
MTLASFPAVSTKVRGLFYGWKLVGLTLLITALAGGPVWNGVGVWVTALEQHFGWSRAQLTGAFSMAQFQGSLVGPVMGYLIDRLGTQRMVFIGFAVAGLGFMIFSRTTNLPIFYFSYFLIMLGVTGGSWLPMMTALNHWFHSKRGAAMGIAGEGSFLGGLVLVPILAWAVTPSNFGWSVTAQWIGIVFLAAAWPLSRLIRNEPQEFGQLPDGETPGQREARLLEQRTESQNEAPDGGLNFTARQALRTQAFWFITFGHALSSMLIATLTVHLVPLLTDQGMSLQTAAYVWSVLMAVGAVFQLLGGYMSDRLPRNQVLFGFAALQTAGFILAAFIDNLPMAILFAIIYGAGFGGRVPITTAIRGDYFGNKAFATITGISMAPLYLFMLAAPLFAAAMFDSTGSYTVAFLILGGLGSMSGVLFLFAKKPNALPVDKNTTPATSLV